jgi:5-methylcytosine-specific restriction endonuclease McrA
MPVKMTKAAINKLLVEERAKMRGKQKQSAFMRRTLSIYNGQTTRMREFFHITKAKLSYSLEEFREGAAKALGGPCWYCECKLTVKTLTPDHATAVSRHGGWGLNNIVFCCQSCNWVKSTLTGKEFQALVDFMNTHLSPESQTNVRRRLVIGGKWSPR